MTTWQLAIEVCTVSVQVSCMLPPCDVEGPIPDEKPVGLLTSRLWRATEWAHKEHLYQLCRFRLAGSRWISAYRKSLTLWQVPVDAWAGKQTLELWAGSWDPHTFITKGPPPSLLRQGWARGEVSLPFRPNSSVTLKNLSSSASPLTCGVRENQIPNK